MNPPHVYHTIGTMSGSSLDGLDVVYCEMRSEPEFMYSILAANTFQYSAEVKQYLKNIIADPKKDYTSEHNYFDTLSAAFIREFVQENNITKIDFIAAHGHTIFHYPEKKITLQIGNGKKIAEEMHCPVIVNFRQADIDAGGQGAPLVPIADKLFFDDFSACLNIGGITNISCEENNNRIGFDICAANQLLNYCAADFGLEYDDGGLIARKGKINNDLLAELNNLEFFKRPFPKSMDNNEIKNNFFPLLDKSNISTPDKLATITEHIAFQITSVIKKQIRSQQIEKNDYKILVTGGGAYNIFLLERTEYLAEIKMTVPGDILVQYKEALAMCLMGLLRWENKPNFLPSVTGAEKAVSGGEIINYDN